jgi:hypothetical protein
VISDPGRALKGGEGQIKLKRLTVLGQSAKYGQALKGHCVLPEELASCNSPDREFGCNGDGVLRACCSSASATTASPIRSGNKRCLFHTQEVRHLRA